MTKSVIHRVLACFAIATVAIIELSGCGDGGSNTTTSSGGGATPSAADCVGKTCNADSVCTCLTGGYCPKAGVCTRTCTMHSDCGCPANTSTADLAAGKCNAACVSVSSSTTVCLKVCANNSQCFGTSTCQAMSGYSACL
jgi:hypothetical protein